MTPSGQQLLLETQSVLVWECDKCLHLEQVADEDDLSEIGDSEPCIYCEGAPLNGGLATVRIGTLSELQQFAITGKIPEEA